MPTDRPDFPGAIAGRFLGRKPSPPEARQRVIPLRNFVTLPKKHAPSEWSYTPKAQKTLSQMMGNDREGNCVAVTIMKQLGIATAYAPGSAEVVASTTEASRLYHEIGGPGDNGLVVTEALNYARDVGATVGGRRHKIDGYVFVDPTDVELVNFAGYHFGGLHAACYLPLDWYQNAGDNDVWDNTGSRIIGGHSVPITAADGDTLRISTWAKQPHVTRRAFHGGRYFDELYAVLYNHWYDAGGLDANGVNVSALRDALDAIRNGRDPIIPDDPNPPTPTPPTPTPPNPSGREWSTTFTFFKWAVRVYAGYELGAAKASAKRVDYFKLFRLAWALFEAVRKADWPEVCRVACDILALFDVVVPMTTIQKIARELQAHEETRVITESGQPAD